MPHTRRTLPILLALPLLLVTLAAAVAQDAKPAGSQWINDRQIQQTLLEGASALIEADRAPAMADIAKGLENESCDLDLARPAAEASAPPAAGHAVRVASDTLYDQASPSVVVVGSAYKCERCTNLHVNGASGFILSAEGAVVTNYHVVDQQDKQALVVMTRDGRVFPVVETLAGDKQADVAIVRIDPVDHLGRNAELRPLPLADATRVGQGVRVIHHADGRYYTLTEGIVSRRYTDSHRGESQWITITADYARGSSGGPLFNDAGEVIGIVASTHSVYYDQAEDGTQQNLQMVWKQCVPVESIRALIE
jgi:S1-C subfamily serine protease